MQTTIRREDKQLAIITDKIDRFQYWNAGYRDIARAYHGARAGQALEDAVASGARFLGVDRAMQEYTDDTTLAARNHMALVTVFHMRWEP